MKEASIIGLDLSKRSFQAHGALADGSVAFRKKLTREKSSAFLPSSRAAPSPWRVCRVSHKAPRSMTIKRSCRYSI